MGETPEWQAPMSEKRTYIVSAYHITERMVSVEAESEAEAVTLVKRGKGDCFDSEPRHDVFDPKWTARLPFPGEKTK